MLPVLASALLSGLAVAGALSRLHAIACVTSCDLAALARTLACAHAVVVRDRSVEGVVDDSTLPWEDAVIRSVMGASSQEEAAAAVNEVLLDLDARLRWGAHIPATCARISLFGALLAGVLLIARDARLTVAVIDIVAFGGGGAVISLMAGSEALRMAKAKRKAVDEFMNRLLIVRDRVDQEWR